MSPPRASNPTRVSAPRDPQAGPVARHGADVARRLLAVLASLSLRDGDRIPSERDLTRELGAPRAVVREAIQSLVLIGLLESHIGRGTFIRAAGSEWVSKALEWGLVLGVRNTMDLVEARTHLEVISASLAAARRDDRDLDELRSLVDRMELAGDDRDELTRLDVAFHLALARASKSAVLTQLLESVGTLLEVWVSRVVKWMPAGRLHAEFEEHAEILDAVAAGDAQLARDLMTRAMLEGQRDLVRALQEASRRPPTTASEGLLVVRAPGPVNDTWGAGLPVGWRAGPQSGRAATRRPTKVITPGPGRP